MTRARDNADHGHLAGRRNLIINGGFDVWQRGSPPIVGLTDGIAFASDRTRCSVSGSTLYVYHNLTEDYSFEPLGFENLARWSVTVAGTTADHYVNMSQRIEGSLFVTAGKTVTVSFWARETDDASKDIVVDVGQSFGSGGSAPAYQSRKITLTNTMQRHVLTFDVPSLDGKTIGTNPFLDLGFWLSAGANIAGGLIGNQVANIHITGIQLEIGDKATPFEVRPIGEELALCQRYYESSYRVGVTPGTVTTGGVLYSAALEATVTIHAHISFDFNVLKGALPTMTFWNGDTGVSGSWRWSGGTDISASLGGVSERGATVLIPDINPGANVGTVMFGHWVADAEL